MTKTDLIDFMKTSLLVVPVLSFVTSRVYYSALFWPFELISPKILTFSDYINKAASHFPILLFIFALSWVCYKSFIFKKEESGADPKVKIEAKNLVQIRVSITTLFIIGAFLSLFFMSEIQYVFFFGFGFLIIILANIFKSSISFKQSEKSYALLLTVTLYFVISFSHFLGLKDLGQIDQSSKIAYFESITGGYLEGGNGRLSFLSKNRQPIIIDHINKNYENPTACRVIRMKRCEN